MKKVGILALQGDVREHAAALADLGASTLPVRTPADAALVMQLGAEGVFVGSGIFKSEDPARMANAIVQATTHFDDPKILADVSKGLGAPMRGLAMEAIPEAERLAVRGW